MNKPEKQSLLNEIQSGSPKFSGRVPKIKLVLEAMDQKDYEELIEVLNDQAISAPTISKVLQKRGINLDPPSINKYRRGEFANVIER